MKEYNRCRIYIAYPENWHLEETDIASVGGSISLSSDSGAFWILKKYPSGTDPNSIADEAVEVMQSEYEDIEIERFEKIFFGKMVIGFEMTFFYLDLMNSAKVFCFEQDGQTMAVFWQTGNQLIIHNDETVPLEDVLEAVTYSMFKGRL
ncbi:MAG: hypothetical protein LBT46_04725 [Planctomycetaceae bacterium]|jgi:hypothetical protein|nr:hypothetical protein [Planctomycetaceae bacterium]